MHVSLTTFLDFVSKAGTPKVTIVRNFKKKPPYHPAMDYYKPMREGILSIMKGDSSPDELERVALSSPRVGASANYLVIASGFLKWYKKQNGTWIEPASGFWDSGTLSVAVNPEIGYYYNNQPHMIKLYFKAEALTKNRTGLIANLMALACGSDSARMCILDVRRGNLIVPNGIPDPELTIQLEAEAAYWNTMFDRI